MSSRFQTAISAAAHAIYETEQLIFDIIIAVVGGFTSLQGSDGEVIQVSAMHDSHKIHDKAVSKLVENMACILTFPFNKSSR